MNLGFVTDKSTYVREKLLKEFAARAKTWTLAAQPSKEIVLQWDDYDVVDWDRVLTGDLVANAFVLRKGLIRKAQLAWYLKKYYTKKEGSILRSSVPDTIILELDQRSLHCPALYDAKDALMEKGSKWILKPSVVDKAVAVELIKNYKHLRQVLKKNPDILEWVFQQYIPSPLLINNYKFHIRVYVVVVGDLKVYVHRDMLALFALFPYQESTSADEDDGSDDSDNSDYSEPDDSEEAEEKVEEDEKERQQDPYRLSHITNTCIQQDHPNFDENKSVRALDELASSIGQGAVNKIKNNIYEVVKETFLALIQETSVFMALPNCFELYGFDFLVDTDLNTFILEANSGPDLKNTGNRLDYVIIGLLEGILAQAVDSFFPLTKEEEERKEKEGKKGNLQLVLDHKGKQWGKSKIKLID